MPANHNSSPDMLGAAMAYANMGLAVFPCKPKSKLPATKHGFKNATTDHKQIETWWRQNPQFNIGIATGAVSHLLVIDVDPRNGGDIDVLQEQFGDLPETPIVITGGGGRQYYLAHPGGNISCSSGKLAPGIDVKADGGYVVTPPSIHPSGIAYRWDDSAALGDVWPGAPPTWLAEQLAKISDLSPHGPTSCETDSDPIPPGRRNSTLASIAGHLRRTGLSGPAIEAALLTVNQERCQPPLGEQEIGRIAASVSRYEPDSVTVALVENHYDQIAGANPLGTTDQPCDPGPFPLSLIENAPDIVKRTMEYYQHQAVEVQPVLMLASLIAATGAVLGHKLCDASGLRTNVYTVGVTQTGGGKEATREIIRKIFQYADIEPMCGPEDFASDAGLIAIVEQQNPILFQLDEFGRLMHCINAGPQKNPHLYNVASVLLKFYSKANSVFRSKAYAEVKRNKTIRNPHVCVYGTTIRNNFWKAMNVDSLEGGFLPRLLIFADDSEPQPGRAIETEPPDEVVEFFAGWANRRMTGGNLEQAGTSVIHPYPMIVPLTPDASAMLEQFRQKQKCEQKRYGPLGVLWSRARENAGKLAIIYAAWRNRLDVVIDTEAANWAIAVTDHVVRQTLYQASLCLAEGPFHEMCQIILQTLQGTCQENPKTQSELLRATRNIKPRDRREVIESLYEQELIDMARGKSPKAKKETTFYWRRSD